MDLEQQQLRKKFLSLPEDLQDAISSVESLQILTEIGNKFKLHIDQVAPLIKETSYVLLGISDPTDFVEIISSKLSIDKATASQIVGEINEKIFLKVKESLRNIHSTGGSIKKETAPITPNLIKSVETERLNVPQQTMDILQGKAPAPEKKVDTSILGFQIEKPKGPSTDILQNKMQGGFSIPKSETETRDPGKVVDPYREAF